jgi:hypothetical protein
MTATLAQELVKARQLVGRLALDFKLSDQTIVDILQLTPGELEVLTNGRGLPPPQIEARCRAARLLLTLNGLDAWKQRVNAASGVELLVLSDLTIVAASQSACEAPQRGTGKLIPIQREALVSQNYGGMLPGGVSMTGDGAPGFHGLKSSGLFDGRLRGHQCKAEIAFGQFAIEGIWEMWSVRTPDAGYIGHAVLHRSDSSADRSPEPGVRVEWSRWIA